MGKEEKEEKKSKYIYMYIEAGTTKPSSERYNYLLQQSQITQGERVCGTIKRFSFRQGCIRT